ncbi:MAG: SBBP repeat-containing protein, partial [Kiritimatiellia bacterium]
GYTESSAFPIGNPRFQASLSGTRSAFVSRFLNDLSGLPASTYLGGALLDEATAVAVDISNRVYVVGSTTSTDFPTANTFGASYQTAPGGNGDAFITRLDNGLAICQASTYLGGNQVDAAMALTVSSSTNATWLYVAGYTRSANFPTTANVYDRTHNGGSDAFLVKFGDRLTAAAFANSTYFGGSNDDDALAVMLAPDGYSAYIAGSTESANLPI